MKILGSYWFAAQLKTIGIVWVKDELTGEEKAYIGIGDGESKEADEVFIIAMGTPFPISAIKHLW